MFMRTFLVLSLSADILSMDGWLWQKPMSLSLSLSMRYGRLFPSCPATPSCLPPPSRRVMQKQLRRVKVKKTPDGPSMCVTTVLVRAIFDSMFKGQIDEKIGSVKRRRCGICEVRPRVQRGQGAVVLRFRTVLRGTIHKFSLVIAAISRFSSQWKWRNLCKFVQCRIILMQRPHGSNSFSI